MKRRVKTDSYSAGLPGILWATVLALFTLSAYGQTSPSVGGAPTPADLKLEEIVVTAQKREENLQQVPISAQVIGSQSLEQQNFNSLDALTEIVPSVHVGNNAITNDLFIRGVGSGGNSSFDQSVATFEDDIYHGRSRQSGTTFLDLNRIEILKGPQSTFFGNNAIAGALNIVTKKPGDSFDAWGRALYGMFGQYAVEGAVGGPIVDTLAARLAITRNGESGWTDNVNAGLHAPDENNEAARLTFAYTPTEDFDAILKIEGSRNRTTGTLGGLPSQWANCPRPQFPASFDGNCAEALALGAAVPMGLDNNRNTGLAGQYSQISTDEDVLTLNHHMWGQTFTSVSGFSGYHFNNNWDQAQLPVALITSQIPEKYHQFTQELRIASPSGGAIEYQAGLYFQADHLDFLADTNLPELNGLATALGLPQPIAVQNGFSQDEHVYSIFGSLGWNATDRLKLTVGLRGSRDDKDATGLVDYGTGTQIYGGFVPFPPAQQPVLAPFFFGPANNTQQLVRSDQAWMPSAGIQYQLVPQTMAYFSYNRGFKAGGVNGENGLNQPGTPNEYSPEFVNAYEFGIKSKFFDERVLLNLDVFRSNYKDLQVNTLVFNPALNNTLDAVGNAAASRSQGAELEMQWLVSNDFRLGANITYLDSYYVSYPEAPVATLDSFNGKPYTDLTGQPTQYAPRWSGSFSASYAIRVSADYKLTTQLNPYFTSSYYTSSGDPFFLVNGYLRLDGRLSLENSNGHWAVDLIGKNLTNRIIIVTPGIYIESKEEPRNVAVQFRYRY